MWCIYDKKVTKNLWIKTNHFNQAPYPRQCLNQLWFARPIILSGFLYSNTGGRYLNMWCVNDEKVTKNLWIKTNHVNQAPYPRQCLNQLWFARSIILSDFLLVLKYRRTLSFFLIEWNLSFYLDGESARVAHRVGRAALAAHRREADGDRRPLADAGEHGRLRVLGYVVRHLKVTERSCATSQKRTR